MKMTMPLFGELTIAQVIEAIEETSKVKVVRAALEDGIVTLTYEPIEEPGEPDECEECFECGGTWNYHMDWCLRNEP